jgi:hypothetical protein
MSDAQPTPIELGESVAALARDLGIPTAVIGAYALAIHHFARATEDLDLATSVQLEDLRKLRTAIEQAGFHCHLETPDDLGGKVTVWVRTDEEDDPIDYVEVVNFLNVYRPRRNPAGEAIRNSVPVSEGSALRYPTLPDLIAMKLDTRAPRDEVDVVGLLRANPEADLDGIRATCKKYSLDRIDDVIEYAKSDRR